MLKFLKETEKTAKNINDAIADAMAELNVVNKNEVNIEILDEGAKGFLGIGSKDARVKISIKEPNIAMAKQFLGSIFDAMNLDVDITSEVDDERLKLNLSGDNMGIIIGKRGDTLDSLQYLTSLIINHDTTDYIKLTLDTENYREKRMDALLALADRLAQKVARTGKKYTLEPMNPYERRIIHSTLQNNDKVSTFSVGEDPYRKVVIAPKNTSSGYKKPQPVSTPVVSSPTVSAVAASRTAAAYSSYKRAAPRHDTVKKAENFEAYQATMENGFTSDDNNNDE